MEKLNAFKDLQEKYTDRYGRVTLYPSVNGESDNENPNLFTGEGAMLAKLNGLVTPEYQETVYNSIKTVEIITGLHSRQPNSPMDRHLISFDEHNGIMFSSVMLENRSLPLEIVQYGEKHDWIYIDNAPGAKLIDNPALYASHIRQPRDRAFYKICAHQEVSFFEIAYMSIALYLSGGNTKEETSGKIMSWFRIKTLETLGWDHWMWRWARNKFENKLKVLYNNEYYMEDVMAIYFRDPNHPFHTLIKGLK